MLNAVMTLMGVVLSIAIPEITSTIIAPLLRRGARARARAKLLGNKKIFTVRATLRSKHDFHYLVCSIIDNEVPQKCNTIVSRRQNKYL